MPSILTCLVAKRLGDPNRSSPKETYALRDFASSLLSLVLKRFSTSYSTLKPRITRALLKAYLDNKKPFTTHYGAITGLRVMGKEVVRTLLVPNLKIYAEKSLEAIMVFISNLMVSIDGVLESFECFGCRRGRGDGG